MRFAAALPVVPGMEDRVRHSGKQLEEHRAERERLTAETTYRSYDLYPSACEWRRLARPARLTPSRRDVPVAGPAGWATDEPEIRAVRPLLRRCRACTADAFAANTALHPPPGHGRAREGGNRCCVPT
jgi:hypothetical protein